MTRVRNTENGVVERLISNFSVEVKMQENMTQQISENSHVEAATQSHPDRSFCRTSVLRKQRVHTRVLVGSDWPCTYRLSHYHVTAICNQLSSLTFRADSLSLPAKNEQGQPGVVRQLIQAEGLFIASEPQFI